MKIFYVVGIYDDETERFADTYVTRTAGQAEALAKAEHPGLQVAGVFYIASDGEPLFDN
jgi:hypothetical protein